MIRFGFDVPPAQAVRFFRGKGLKAGFDHRDLLADEHDHAFTVAKMMDLDLLSDVRAAVDRVISEGRSLRDFRAELQPELMRRGWWGRALMTDPLTGEERDVQLGSVRRLKTIFDTNMRTAYAAGQWQRIQDNIDEAPFLYYSATLDARTRPLHRSWHGTILRADHEWWQTHLPPNGWSCRCTVIQMSARDLQRLGRSGPDAQAPRSPTREVINARTGEISQVPVGIDPGFDRIPGATRVFDLLENARAKAEGASPDFGAAFIRRLVGDQFRRWFARPEGAFPVARLDESLADTLQARNRVLVLAAEQVAESRAAQRALTVDDFARLPDIAGAPDLVVRDSPRSVVLLRRSGDVWLAATRPTTGDAQDFITAFRRMTRREVRALVSSGTLISGEVP